MGATYVVTTRVVLDRDIVDAGRVTVTVEPGEFTPRTAQDKAIAAWLVGKGLAALAPAVKSDKEA